MNHSTVQHAHTCTHALKKGHASQASLFQNEENEMGEHMTRRLATQRSASSSVIMSLQGLTLALLALGLCTQLAAARPGVLTSAPQQVRSCLVACSVLQLHYIPVPASPPPHTPVPASHTKRES